MLRHACGYALANAGHHTRALQAWLGHKNIQHTVRYTELSPDRFNFRPSSASPNARDFADSSVATRTPGCE
jgi:site-specific recombinase XerD